MTDKKTTTFLARHVLPHVLPLGLLALTGGCVGEVGSEGGSVGAASVAAGSVYTLVRSGSGKCLDIASAGTADGTNIQQWSCDGKVQQSFRVDDLGGGAVRLVSPYSNKCVDVAGASLLDGANVQLWTCNGTPAQSYTIEDVGGGYSRVRNAKSGKCLDVAAAGTADGTNVQQYACNGTSAQSWQFNLVGGGGAGGGGAGGGGSAGGTAKQKVLAYLAGISGKKTAIGVENKNASDPTADSDTMASMSGNGQSPSFWSADWGFGTNLPSSRQSIVQEGEKQWAAGAIVQFIYHACPVTMGADENCTYQDSSPGQPIKGSVLSAAQWTDLVTPGGTLNKVWLARLDVLAPYFAELKAAGVAPLFRPLHEMNGSWAWWTGHPGANGSARLFQITHDYLTNTKGLDNIVWVWNVQDFTTLASDVGQYTPGTSYFDIAALDVYNTGYTQGNYNAMVGAAGGKPIGVAECQFLPTPSLLASQPLWTYVALWPDFFSQNTSQIPALFSDGNVVKLAQMPGWN